MFLKSGPALPRRRSTRRYAFLTLLLIALAAPIGWVAARVPDAPYVVIFNDAAVTVPYSVTAADASFLSRASANPAAVSATGNDSRGVAHRRVDADRVNSQIHDIAARNGIGEINDVYNAAVGGFAARLNASQSAAIAADPAVAAVIPDEEFSLDDGAAALSDHVRTTANPQYHVQPGIRRIGARSPGVESLTAGGVKVDADVAILDTGVQRNHPDLNVVGGYNCTGRDRTKWDDGDGHGTHVAGIVGALDNSFGVTGVAPGVRLWSVKVLDNEGHGFVSWLVCGVDWVTAQRDRFNQPLIEVANMSLAFGGGDDHACGNKNHDMLHQAICRSVDRGTVYVVAAGNDSKDAVRSRPASYDEVITVSAMADYDGRGGGHGVPSDSCPYWSSEPDDAFTSFSNFGADVDLTAPGKCILSTYFGSRYGWLSGTSMATPHVTGAAVVYLMRFPRATPSQVRAGLQAVGTLDWRTASDPDKNHEKAVWIGQFKAAPDFSMTTSATSGIVRPGSNLTMGISLTRVAGFEEPVTISLVGAPSSISATPTVTRADTTTLTIRIAADARVGSYPITVQAAAHDVVRTEPITIIVKGGAPHAGFSSPQDGQTVQSATTVDVNWNQQGTAAVPSGRLERQVAAIRSPGSCSGASFTTDWVRTASMPITDQLSGGKCYRWVLTLTDAAGHHSTVISGAVLVDPTTLPAPTTNTDGRLASTDT